MQTMYKIMLICGVLMSTTSAFAQYYDHVIGVRGGTSVELSYKRFVAYYPSIQQAVEGLIGFQFDERRRSQNGYIIEGLYHLHMDVGFNTGFSAFVGGGLYTGVYTEPAIKPRWGGGVTGLIGMEYTFTHAPVNISIDWKPFLGTPRSSLIGGGISLRYVFSTTWQ